VNIQVFSDVVCPWCYIGSTRLDRVLAELGMEANVSYLPFMIAPDTPPGGFDVAEDLRRKYGVDPRRLWDRAEAQARESGLELDLSRQKMSYPTAAAHTLIRHAGPRGTQRALVRALFEANFQQALHIADPEVLAPLGARHGFTEEEARKLVTDPGELLASRRAAGEAVGMGIRGAPFFILQGKIAFSGAQPEEVFRQALEEAREG
jgi:predicted DsbA family dithiol-disulfide isomerase